MRRTRASFGLGGMTPMVKNILIANGVVFLVQLSMGSGLGLTQGPQSLGIIGYYFALVPELVLTRGFVWQLISYQFLHGGLFHILINMFMVWMFGRELEALWGPWGFLRFYLVCGVAAGGAMLLFGPASTPTVGASGAMLGLLGAFAFYWPNRRVYVWGIFPIQIKYLVLILGAFSLYAGMAQARSNVAHLAHLGGLLMGLLYVWKGDPRRPLTSFLQSARKQWRVQRKQRQWEEERERREQMVRDADRILDKLQEMSWEDLPEDEKQRIRQISEELDSVDRPGDSPPG